VYHSVFEIVTVRMKMLFQKLSTTIIMMTTLTAPCHPVSQVFVQLYRDPGGGVPSLSRGPPDGREAACQPREDGHDGPREGEEETLRNTEDRP
jgi:hypothetical protein